MEKLKYFHPRFKYKKHESDKYKVNENHVCFAELTGGFGHVPSDVSKIEDMDIIFYFYILDIDELSSGRELTKLNNNYSYCIIQEDLVRKHLEQVKDIVKFDYTLNTTNTDIECCKFAELNIHVQDKWLYKNYLLTWIKYLIESPFNYWIYDVYKLKESIFKDKDIEEILYIVSRTYSFWNSNHSVFSTMSKFISRDIIKYELEKQNNKNKRTDPGLLNNIYPEYSSVYGDTRPDFPKNNKLEEQIDNKINIEERFPIYLEIDKILILEKEKN